VPTDQTQINNPRREQSQHLANHQPPKLRNPRDDEAQPRLPNPASGDSSKQAGRQRRHQNRPETQKLPDDVRSLRRLCSCLRSASMAKSIIMMAFFNEMPISKNSR
jgi:hypothetical protein